VSDHAVYPAAARGNIEIDCLGGRPSGGFWLQSRNVRQIKARFLHLRLRRFI
jgi:hypothetical protein